MRRYYLWILVIFFSLTVGYQILALWRGVILSQKNLSEERLLKAIKVDPGNPEPFHKLGILHQWGLLHIDLKQSGKYIRKAIERNPLDQKYWLNLAKSSTSLADKPELNFKTDSLMVIRVNGLARSYSSP